MYSHDAHTNYFWANLAHFSKHIKNYDNIYYIYYMHTGTHFISCSTKAYFVNSVSLSAANNWSSGLTLDEVDSSVSTSVILIE